MSALPGQDRLWEARTAEGFFVPLFFASAGLHLSPEFLKLPPETILALVLVPLAGKFAAAFISAYITRLDAPFAIATGLMAKGVAEIALLLLLLHTGAIDKGVFSLLVLVMFGYILLTPMGISFAIGDSNIPKTLLPKDRCRRRWIDSPWKESGCETSWTALEAIRSNR